MNKTILLSEDDLKEIFRLFTTLANDELKLAYSEDHPFFFKRVNLDEEYELCEEKREFAFDAWRAVIYFLYAKGYVLSKGEEIIDLSFSKSLFVGTT